MTTRKPAARRGRPPVIDKNDIAEAVRTLGGANVTMRTVADHLGVSLPGLYHHVRNHEELLRLTTHATLVDNPPPLPRGEHWATFLRTYATYVRTVLDADPALVELFVAGAVRPDDEIDYVAHAVSALTDQGMTPTQAMHAWAAVSAMAIGSVAEAHREHLNTQDGNPWHSRTARTEIPDAHPLRESSNAGFDPFGGVAFDQRITLLLTGIAVQFKVSLEDGRDSDLDDDHRHIRPASDNGSPPGPRRQRP